MKVGNAKLLFMWRVQVGPSPGPGLELSWVSCRDSLWKGAMTFSGSLAEACGVGEAWPTSAENSLDVGG